MPLDDLAGEAIGGTVRLVGRIIFEVVLEIMIRGPGYLVCRACGYKGDIDGFLPAFVGVMFWATLVIGGYLLLAADFT